MAQAPTVAYSYEVRPTFRALDGRFVAASEDFFNSRRDTMRGQARRLVAYLKEEAPKKTGAFAKKIGFRTFYESDAFGFKIFMPQPLGMFIVEGTRSHRISAKRGKALRFFWERGPQGPGIYFYNNINHPGTKPNRFTGRAVRRWKPGMRRDARGMGLRYAQILQGKRTAGRT